MRALADSYDLWSLDVQGKASDRHVIVDIGDEAALRSAFESMPKCDAVIHLAADPRPGAPFDSVLHANLVGTHNLYECAREFHVPQVVFASTNRTMFMYEADEPEMLTVSDPVRPGSDYAASKVYGEALARHYWDKFGIRSTCIRIGSLVHPDDPTKDPRHRMTWLSHRDCAQLFKKALDSNVDFGVYFGVSGNRDRFWDISNAEKELGYKPQDDASNM